MNIHVNGEPRPLTADSTVLAVLEQLDMPRDDVAVAVDGVVVPRSSWTTTTVPDGARVEVVTAKQGG